MKTLRNLLIIVVMVFMTIYATAQEQLTHVELNPMTLRHKIIIAGCVIIILIVVFNIIKGIRKHLN